MLLIPASNPSNSISTFASLDRENGTWAIFELTSHKYQELYCFLMLNVLYIDWSVSPPNKLNEHQSKSSADDIFMQINPKIFV